MDFRAAVEKLNETTTREEIAKDIGVSFHSVRQALLPQESQSHRAAPPGWRPVLARLARERAQALLELADRLDAGE